MNYTEKELKGKGITELKKIGTKIGLSGMYKLKSGDKEELIKKILGKSQVKTKKSPSGSREEKRPASKESSPTKLEIQNMEPLESEKISKKTRVERTIF